MKTKIWKFDPVIYPFPLLVCKYISGVTDKELKDKFYVIGDNDEQQEATEEDFKGNPTTCARTIQVIDKSNDAVSLLIILFNPNLIDDGTVAHEAFHFATMMGDWLGFPKVDFKNDEPYAYLIQWVTNCTVSVLRNTPKQMEGELYG